MSFPGVVQKAWGRARPLQESIKNFSRKAVDWNKHHFGNIFGRKKRVMARLNGIQKAIAAHPSHSPLELVKVLQNDLNALLDQEEELWVQKSRISRLIEGDRNTAFHHISTIVRRRRNKISYIKNEVGEWIQSEVGAMNYIRGGFEKLFTTSLDYAPLNPIWPSRWLATLFDEESYNMSTMVIDAEIKDGLWALKSSKAPGPDGLHAGFFQSFWLTVGDLVKAEVPEYLNRTNVVFIPNIAGLESLGNYRPISLCNIVYKTVTKILVARIRPYLDKLVSPLQSAFVPGRKV